VISFLRTARRSRHQKPPLSCLLLIARRRRFTSTFPPPSGAPQAYGEHGVAPLVWSSSLAASAQQYSSTCIRERGAFSHAPDAFVTFGENLSWPGQTPSGAVDACTPKTACRLQHARSFNGGGYSLHAGWMAGATQLGCWSPMPCRTYVCRPPPGNSMREPGVPGHQRPRR